MCINEDLPYKERISTARNEGQLYTTINHLPPPPLAPKALTNQGTHNLHQLWHSNLRSVFGRYHTDIFCKVFFVPISQVLSRAREDCAAY